MIAAILHLLLTVAGTAIGLALCVAFCVALYQEQARRWGYRKRPPGR